MSLIRVLSFLADVIRGRNYYGKYDKMYKRNLIEIPSFKLILTLTHGKVLDIGCGIGYLSTLFDDYVGIDINKEAIKIAKKKARREYIIANATDLPFRSDAFGTCVSYDSIEHVKNINRALAEIRRVSNKAVISCVDFSSYYRFFTYDEGHVGLPKPGEIASLLAKCFTYVRMFRSSGIFKAPRSVNTFLSRYLPNQIILEAFTKN